MNQFNQYCERVLASQLYLTDVLLERFSAT